ncbi:MAG: hypothetical protein DDT32_01671 [Syntrophomonadaceae bacterium]|nr:hypothetical protein [Bacillota bacterium]
MIEIDALSVGQFTGITDTKGVEIYTGDIVSCWGGEYTYGVWEFQDSVTILDYIGDSFQLSHHEYHEVQGNIFNTNPQPTEPVTPWT